MTPACAITGRAVDASTGQPLAGLSVVAYLELNGSWIASSELGIRSPVTDALGAYSLPQLWPGTYRVRVVDTGATTGDDTQDCGGKYADRYYPNVTSIGSASNIMLASGQSRAGVDVQMGGVDPDIVSTPATVETTAGPCTAVLAGGSTQTKGIIVNFADGGTGGVVTARPIDSLDTSLPPDGSMVGQIVDISTTVMYDGRIKITMYYDPALVQGSESEIKLYHYENGQWADITDHVDTEANTVTGYATSLSPFVILQQSEEQPVVSTPASSPWSLILASLAVLLLYGINHYAVLGPERNQG